MAHANMDLIDIFNWNDFIFLDGFPWEVSHFFIEVLSYCNWPWFLGFWFFACVSFCFCSFALVAWVRCTKLNRLACSLAYYPTTQNCPHGVDIGGPSVLEAPCPIIYTMYELGKLSLSHIETVKNNNDKWNLGKMSQIMSRFLMSINRSQMKI